MENDRVSLRVGYLESFDALTDALPAALQQQISAIRDLHAEAYRLIQEAESCSEVGAAHGDETNNALSKDVERETIQNRIKDIDEILEHRHIFVAKLFDLVRNSVSRVDQNFQLYSQYKSSESELPAASNGRNGRSAAGLAPTGLRRRPEFLEGTRKREHASVSVTSRRSASTKRVVLRKSGGAVHLGRRGNGGAAERAGSMRSASRTTKRSDLKGNGNTGKADDDDEEDEDDAEEGGDGAEVAEESDRRGARGAGAARRVPRRPGKRRQRLVADNEGADNDSDREQRAHTEAAGKKERDNEADSSSSSEDDENEPDDEDEREDTTTATATTKRQQRRAANGSDSDAEAAPTREEAAASDSGADDDASPQRRTAETQNLARRKQRFSTDLPRAAAANAKRNSTNPRGGAASKAKKAAAASGSSAQFNPADHFVIEPDEPTYCLCAQVSYGEMIGCDNSACTVEWFHFACVSLKTKPKGKWYCPLCRAEPNRSNVMRKRSDKKG